MDFPIRSDYLKLLGQKTEEKDQAVTPVFKVLYYILDCNMFRLLSEAIQGRI
jgi:hypothetical protein